MKTTEIKILIKEGEGLTIEFKEKYTPKIVQDLVAFANSKGGKILIGVTDDGKIKGEKLSNKMKAEIVTLARNCEPAIELSVKQIEDIILIEVKEGEEKPYSCSYGYYKRLDAVTQKLTQKEISGLYKNSTERTFDDKICDQIKIEDISLNKVKYFFKEAGININVTKNNLLNILSNINISNENKINNTGVLFFASNVTKFISNSEMVLLAFKGKERVDIFDRKDVSDDLLTQFNEAVFFLEKHLNKATVINGVNRDDVYEIPIPALREAVANAIIHRDYSVKGTQIQIEVFPDRVDILNPGTLLPPVTTKNLGIISKRRNHLIADMFFRLHKVEKSGTGINRIKAYLKSANVKQARFKEVSGFFKISFLRGNVTENVTENVTDERIVKLVDLLTMNPKISTIELASKLNVTKMTVLRDIEKLKKDNLLTRVGTNKGGYWKVLKTK